MVNQQQTTIEFKNVSYAYENRAVLESISFQTSKNEALYVVGPNGGGKTTLLKLVAGLLKPDRGEINILGDEPCAVCKHIGYVPQNLQFDTRFPISVEDVVLQGRLGHSISGRYSRQDRDAALHALEQVNMAGLEKVVFSELSGGQQQRVLIARALCDSPSILLLDEAVSNIDEANRSRIYDILGNIKKEITTLLVSHDLGFVHNIFDRVMLVNKSAELVKTCDLNGDLIEEMYGKDHRIIHYHG